MPCGRSATRNARQWKRLPFNETRYRKELGAPKLFGESGYTTLERTWARPTLEVNGLLAGFTGEGAKTVIPAVSMAKVSMRLVPDQDPDTIAKLFEDYVRKVTPKTVEVKVTRMHGGKPWMTDFDNPFVQAAGRAIEKGFGKTPVFNREGGSIPVVATFQEILRLPSVLFGVGLPDENAHAPNEKLDLGNFHGGIVASAFLYDEMAKTQGVACVAIRLLARGARRVRGSARARLRRSRARAAEGNDEGVLRPGDGQADRADLRRQQERPHRYLDRDGRDAGPLRSRIDSNEDGRIDRWEYYDAAGRLAKVGFSRKADEKPDAWAYSTASGRIDRIEISSTGDPAHIDRWEFYDTSAAAAGAGADGTGPLLRVDEDTNRDGRPDKWERYADGLVAGRRVRREPRRPSRPPPDLPGCRARAD